MDRFVGENFFFFIEIKILTAHYFTNVNIVT